MALEDMVQKILSARPDLAREEVLRKIEKKEKEAKGFLTSESAARAVAAELGVGSSRVSFKHRIFIGDFISGLGDVSVEARVIFVFPPRSFVRSDGTGGKMRRLLVADGTGEAKVVLWDDKAEMPNMENLTGQVVRFGHGYVRRGFDGDLELNIGLRGTLDIASRTFSGEEFPPLTSFIKRIGQITAKKRAVNVLGVVGEIFPVSLFRREDGSEGKVRRLELKDDGGRVTVVLWNTRVDELPEIESGRYMGVLGAKVRESLEGYFELHVDNSADVAVLPKNWQPPMLPRNIS